MDLEEALAEFDSSGHKYLAVRDATVPMLTRILNNGGIFPHSVTPRIKTRESVKDKLRREDKEYTKLSDLKDVVGIRVITYFEDELETVDRIIKREFEISDKDSYDRKSLMGTDQFGYRSIHYVCTYKQDRLNLQEYGHLAGCVLEIQTRSILQHAWAEIEHEYYKAGGPKPEAIRRRNSRLAGLLELVDAEFIAIRKDMEAYRRNIDLRIDADKDLQDVKLDAVSVSSFISQEANVAQLDQRISAALGVSIRQESIEKSIPVMLRAFESVGISTLEELRNALHTHREHLLPFLRSWRDWARTQGRALSDSYAAGISVYHLALFMAALEGESSLDAALTAVNKKRSDDTYIRATIKFLPTLARSNPQE